MCIKQLKQNSKIGIGLCDYWNIQWKHKETKDRRKQKHTQYNSTKKKGGTHFSAGCQLKNASSHSVKYVIALGKNQAHFGFEPLSSRFTVWLSINCATEFRHTLPSLRYSFVIYTIQIKSIHVYVLLAAQLMVSEPNVLWKYFDRLINTICVKLKNYINECLYDYHHDLYHGLPRPNWVHGLPQRWKNRSRPHIFFVYRWQIVDDRAETIKNWYFWFCLWCYHSHAW